MARAKVFVEITCQREDAEDIAEDIYAWYMMHRIGMDDIKMKIKPKTLLESKLKNGGKRNV